MSKWKTPLDDNLPHDGKCLAYGCPLPGTTSRSTVGAARDWVCRFHFFADPTQWQETTRKLNVKNLLPDEIEEVNF